MISVHNDFRGAISDPRSIQEALALLRSLSRLEFIITLNGVTQRCPIRLSDDNAVVVIGGLSSASVSGTSSSGGLPASPAEGGLAYFNGTSWVNLPLGDPGDVLTVNPAGTAPMYAPPADLGRWEPVTNGDPAAPEIVFSDAGDVVMAFVPG